MSLLLFLAWITSWDCKKIAIGLAKLPSEVDPPIVERQKASDSIPFIVVSLESSSMDFASFTHYANLNLKNAFRGLKGVAFTEVWGQPHTDNIVLNALKMYAFGVNADDVFDALKESTFALPVGRFQNEIPVTLNTEFKTIADYEKLVVKTKNSSYSNHAQHAVLLKQIADIELKTDDQQFRVRINGKPGLCIGIDKANDANPLDVATLVHAQLDSIRQNLPDGLHINIISDQADFVRYSLKNIKYSIGEAIVFVLLIVFLFLRNMRATMIPLITIPISLIGSFLFLKIFGFSINIMTLLAMVLAVGLVVDDAIVVLEKSNVTLIMGYLHLRRL